MISDLENVTTCLLEDMNEDMTEDVTEPRPKSDEELLIGSLATLGGSFLDGFWGSCWGSSWSSSSGSSNSGGTGLSTSLRLTTMWHDVVNAICLA